MCTSLDGNQLSILCLRCHLSLGLGTSETKLIVGVDGLSQNMLVPEAKDKMLPHLTRLRLCTHQTVKAYLKQVAFPK